MAVWVWGENTKKHQFTLQAQLGAAVDRMAVDWCHDGLPQIKGNAAPSVIRQIQQVRAAQSPNQ